MFREVSYPIRNWPHCNDTMSPCPLLTLPAYACRGLLATKQGEGALATLEKQPALSWKRLGERLRAFANTAPAYMVQGGGGMCMGGIHLQMLT